MGDVKAIVAELGTQPVAIGASLGGLVALMTEGLNDDNYLRGIVLVDIVPRMERTGVGRVVGFMRQFPDGFATVDEAADAVADYLPERPRPEDTSGLKKNLRQRDDGRWVWHWDPEFLNKDGADSREMMLAIQQAPAGIAVPTLLVRGLKSDVVSDEGVKDLLEKIPHAEYADVRGAGHMVAGDKNDAFNQVVIDWMQTTFSTN